MFYLLKITTLSAFLISLVLPAAVLAENSSKIVISEVQTGLPNAAAKEFIELYNPAKEDLNISGWKIKYKSGSGDFWSQKVILDGIIPAHGFYLIAANGYLDEFADAQDSLGLAAVSGHVRLEDQAGKVIDLLGWGESANAAEGRPTAAPKPGESLERMPGLENESAGNSIDTDNNSDDFLVRDTDTGSEPQNSLSTPEIPGAASESSEKEEERKEDKTAPLALPLRLNELFIDPAAPMTDGEDEFIELFNPNEVRVSLAGYTLEITGKTSRTQVLTDGVIEPLDYLVLSGSALKLQLANSGGKLRLLSPGGNLLDEVSYGKSKSGMAYALAENGSWTWTTIPTPRAQNLISLPPVLSAEEAVAGAGGALKAMKPVRKASLKAPKKSSSKIKKAAASKGKKTAKAKKEKSSKTVKAMTAKPAEQPLVAAATNSKIGFWLLIGAVIFTIGYALYEFRYDIQNAYLRARRNIRARKETR